MATGVLECIREDDFVEYFLFINGIEDDLNANEEAKQIWESNLQLIRSLICDYAEGYIWHKDGFNVNVRDGSHFALCDDSESLDKAAPPHLYGITHFGDNIEDEWFVVYLLLQLTKAVKGLIIRVVDSDGEFLLIESADVLPAWATPETCERRVYLYDGAIHVVPRSNDEEEEELSMPQALSRIRAEPTLTLASEEIQKAVLARVKGYPEKIGKLLHRTTAFVPVAVAALLKERPQLVAPAVHAFCNRDPIDMKACRAMRYFPPEVCVKTSVVFTRCLYAALQHQKYTPDRRTGWPTLAGNNQLAQNIGIKLACGFEILVTEAKLASSEKAWLRYVESLKKRGYFMDLLEGSQQHSALLAKARDYFDSNKSQLADRPDVGQDILDLMAQLEYDIKQMKLAEKTLPEPDDDGWLALDPSDVDAMLEHRYGRHNVNDEADISSRLTHFLEHVSGVEGAEFPQDTPPERPKRGVKKKAAAPAMDDSMMTSSIAFDSEAFSCAVQNILDLVVPEDKWVSDDSDMSSYEDEVDMDLAQLKDSRRSDDELKQYMDQMDRELSKTTLGQSFARGDDFADVEDFQPVDVDLNAVRNVLESYHAQGADAGPAENLLGPMGVRFQPPKPDNDDTD